MTGQEFGVIGLGRIGGGLALQALQKGMRVVGYTLGGAGSELLQAGLQEVRDLSGFRETLAAPRRVFLYIPAGPGVDELLDSLASVLEPGDIAVDGGNSYWGDSIRRHARLQERGIHLVDVGTSGGVEGARGGACFMAGGEPEPVARLEPILTALAVPGGFVHAATSRSWCTTASSSGCCRRSGRASTCWSGNPRDSTFRRYSAAGGTAR
jgi:6-phosphogluconate dehydrogenase